MKFYFVFTFGGFAIPATDPENNLREFDRELQILIFLLAPFTTQISTHGPVDMALI